MSEYAEALYEELGGGLCVCQLADVSHWCETCQRRLQLIDEAFQRHVERQTVPAVAAQAEGSQAAQFAHASSSSFSPLTALIARWREKAGEANRIATAAICLNAVATAASSGREADVRTEMADELSALLPSLTDAKGRTGWQPIETAPKDGTTVLIATASGFQRVAGFARCGWTYYQKYGGPSVVVMDATYWMPLPEPPA